jgi:hypothetical protein
MAMNLRLSPDLEKSLKERSATTGRAQQDLIREAIRNYLRHETVQGLPPRDGVAIPPPRDRYRKTDFRLPLPPGVSSSVELIDRTDRFID